MYDTITGNVCENFMNYFEVLNNNTRNKNKLLKLPRIKLESSCKRFGFNGAKTYNELPLHVTSAESKEEFKKLLNYAF